MGVLGNRIPAVRTIYTQMILCYDTNICKNIREGMNNGQNRRIQIKSV